MGSCLWNLKRGIEKFETKVGSLEQVKSEVLRKAAQYLVDLEAHATAYDEVTDEYPVQALKEQYGLSVGDTVDFEVAGVTQKIIIDHVHLSVDEKGRAALLSKTAFEKSAETLLG